MNKNKDSFYLHPYLVFMDSNNQKQTSKLSHKYIKHIKWQVDKTYKQNDSPIHTVLIQIPITNLPLFLWIYK